METAPHKNVDITSGIKTFSFSQPTGEDHKLLSFHINIDITILEPKHFQVLQKSPMKIFQANKIFSRQPHWKCWKILSENTIGKIWSNTLFLSLWNAVCIGVPHFILDMSCTKATRLKMKHYCDWKQNKRDGTKCKRLKLQ